MEKQLNFKSRNDSIDFFRRRARWYIKLAGGKEIRRNQKKVNRANV